MSARQSHLPLHFVTVTFIGWIWGAWMPKNALLNSHVQHPAGAPLLQCLVQALQTNV